MSVFPLWSLFAKLQTLALSYPAAAQPIPVSMLETAQNRNLSATVLSTDVCYLTELGGQTWTPGAV